MIIIVVIPVDEKIRKEENQITEREELISQLTELLHRFTRKVKQEMNQLDQELTMSDFLVLRYIREKGPINVSDIAKHLQVSLSHVTNISDRLIAKGLIDRVRSVEDRRVVVLTLLPEGERVALEIHRRRKEYLEQLLEKVSDEELKLLIQIFTKIYESSHGRERKDRRMEE